MAKTNTTAEPAIAPEAAPAVPSALVAKEVAIDQAIDAWLVTVANDGTGTALRILGNQSQALKKTIHTILEEI